VDSGGLPLDRFVIRISIPDGVWAAREERHVATLPPTWAAIPAGKASVAIGSAWLAALQSAILLVPSVIVPEEPSALINPAHPDAKTIKAAVVRQFEYDRLFRPE
jgi:RES domain-containing protein